MRELELAGCSDFLRRQRLPSHALLGRREHSSERVREEHLERDVPHEIEIVRVLDLVAQNRGVAPAVAKRWISQQSCRTGLSKSDVADRIIAYDQAIGLSQQKIA